MSNDPWGSGPVHPPRLPPPHGYPNYGGHPHYGGQFGAPAPPAPPGLTATVIVTLLAGIFGVIPASLHASRAQQMGYPGGRYWKAFGITFGALVFGQVLVVAAMVAAGLVSLGPIVGLSAARPAGWAPAGAPIVSPTRTTISDPHRTPRTARPSQPGPERTGRQEPTRTPRTVSIVTGSGGDSCTAAGGSSAWGGYPLADCRTWKDSNGLRTGAPLSRKSLSITCQADLQERNPVLTAGQSNTWWVWTQADNGTWDWFPETAIAQGATNQPINGIARCQ